MVTPSQPPGQLTRSQAEEHAEQILRLVQAQDVPGLVAYLNEQLPQQKWDGMVFIYARSRELQGTIFRGQVTITGRRRLPTGATIANLANILLS